MPNRKLLKIISLCLVIFFCRFAQPVRLLDTGYTYPNELGDRQPDLKCAYWFSSLMHMRLTKILLDMNGPDFATLNEIADYNSNVNMKSQLSILYDLGERIGALWLIHLYTSILNGFLENPLTGTFAPKSIITTHNYIIDKLQLEVDDQCRQGNRYDWRVKEFPRDELGEEWFVIQMILENTFSIKDLDKENHTKGLITAKNTNRFHSTHIFLFGAKGKLNVIQHFTIAFSSAEISWEISKKWFLDIWTIAHTLLWAYNDLVPIKTYITTTVNLFKVIMFRLTWKLLVYFEFEKASDVPGFVEQWLVIIQDFANALAINEDVQMKYLLKAFNLQEITKQEYSAKLIRYLQTCIILISDKIGCDATKKLNASDLNGIINPCYIRSVVKLCIKQGAKMITNIEDTFEGTSFDVIWSLIDYIDDLNKHKLF